MCRQIRGLTAVPQLSSASKVGQVRIGTEATLQNTITQLCGVQKAAIRAVHLILSRNPSEPPMHTNFEGSPQRHRTLLGSSACGGYQSGFLAGLDGVMTRPVPSFPEKCSNISYYIDLDTSHTLAQWHAMPMALLGAVIIFTPFHYFNSLCTSLNHENR